MGHQSILASSSLLHLISFCSVSRSNGNANTLTVMEWSFVWTCWVQHYGHGQSHNSEPSRLFTRLLQKDQRLCVHLYKLHPRPGKQCHQYLQLCAKTHMEIFEGPLGKEHIYTWGHVLLGTLESRQQATPHASREKAHPPQEDCHWLVFHTKVQWLALGERTSQLQRFNMLINTLKTFWFLCSFGYRPLQNTFKITWGVRKWTRHSQLNLLLQSKIKYSSVHGILQYSCLENSMDRGAWWATVHGVAKCWTQTEWLTYT